MENEPKKNNIEEQKDKISDVLMRIIKMILFERTHKWKHTSQSKYLNSISSILGKDLSWFFNGVFGFTQAVAKGFSIKVVLALLLYLIKRKNFMKTLAGIFSKDTFSFSMYWGLMVSIYKFTMWALRSLGRTDDKINSIIAGTICSLATLADRDEDRRKTLILYILARAVETSINYSNNHKIVNVTKHIYLLMYNIKIATFINKFINFKLENFNQ